MILFIYSGKNLSILLYINIYNLLNKTIDVKIHKEKVKDSQLFPGSERKENDCRAWEPG